MKIERVPSGETGISGFGLISAAGNGQVETLRTFFSSADPPLPRPAPEWTGMSLRIPVFALEDFHPDEGKSRSLALAEQALEQALAQACLSREALKKSTTGICIGSTVAAQHGDLALHAKLRSGHELDATLRASLRKIRENSPAEYLKQKYGLTGPAAIVSNTCTSGADAIGLGALWIESGVCDTVLAIGMDEINMVPLAGFYVLGATSDSPCMPFDKNRSGLNLGEGAGALVLEKISRAKKRGACCEFTLAGYGVSGDACHMTAPHPEGAGLLRALDNAFRYAGGKIRPEEIAFINAHGTATLANDLCESNALIRFFGPGLRYFSTKRYTGHTLGAAGALEAIFSLLMLRERKIPASCGFHEKPDDIPVAPVRKETRLEEDARFAVSTSLAFGGSNSALILERRL